MIGYSENQYIDVCRINIQADSLASNRGYGAFDFFGIINGKPFYPERHLDRFFRTMKLMRLEIDKSRQEIESIINSLIEQNQLSEFYIKLFAFPEETITESTIKSQFYALPVIIPENTDFDYLKGVKLISKEYQRFLPEAKSTNYLPLIYWQNEILKHGAVDVLYHSNGEIRETSRGNVFLVKNNVVYTPEENVLHGITRSIAIDLLKKKNIQIFQQVVPIDIAIRADEVFLTSTMKHILPVTRINNSIIKEGMPGPISKLVFDEFMYLKRNW